MENQAALEGLRVVDLSNVRTGVQVSQFLADFGAEVIHVEPPGGSPMRADRAWPYWGRGKKSIELNLKDPADLEAARRLALQADVVIETFRPGVADRLRLGYAELSAGNPGLVYASITGFGATGPYADLQGYEGVVYAKMGVLWHVSGMAPRAGPAFPSVAYASYPATQLALQAIMAALYERETTGVGQAVSTSLAQALSAHDTPNWFARVMAQKFNESFKQVGRFENGAPAGGLFFRILLARTKDGEWLQFAQTAEKLFRAMMRMFGLDWMYDDPKWRTAPEFDDAAQRIEYWEMLLNTVASKTAAEWAEAFDRDPNVFGARISKGTELLDHPQMQFNRMVSETLDPHVGRLRQPAPLTRADKTPGKIGVAPSLGEHAAELRARAAVEPAKAAPASAAAKAGRPPLEGVTVVELATYYAAPFGATLLAELGARVIKLEQLDGDPHRNMLPFPEIAGIKALQGKESVAVDLATPKGREVAHRILAKADIVLQSFRAGVAERIGVDEPTLRVLNPGLIYMAAPGYGEGGPYGHRPAYAPSISAGAGWPWRNAGALFGSSGERSLDDIKKEGVALAHAVSGYGNADCAAAVSVATAMMLGLLARERGAGGQKMFTTMLSSAAHAVGEMMVEHEGGGDMPVPDRDLYGWSALYRVYETAEEWVFLAAPSEREWARLASVLADEARLADDPRFATAAERKRNDADLAEVLGEIFLGRKAADWERIMRAADVACVVCARAPVEAHYMDEGGIGRLQDWVTEAYHPILDTVPRMKPLVSFSRSSTRADGAGLCGQETEKILREYGYSAEEVSTLAKDGVITLG